MRRWIKIGLATIALAAAGCTAQAQVQPPSTCQGKIQGRWHRNPYLGTMTVELTNVTDDIVLVVVEYANFPKTVTLQAPQIRRTIRPRSTERPIEFGTTAPGPIHVDVVYDGGTSHNPVIRLKDCQAWLR